VLVIERDGFKEHVNVFTGREYTIETRGRGEENEI